MIEEADNGRLMRFLRTLIHGKAAQKCFEHELDERRKNAPLVDALFEIAGVTSVSLKPYEVTIIKAKDFDWIEIETAALDVFEKFAFCRAK